MNNPFPVLMNLNFRSTVEMQETRLCKKHLVY